MDFDGLFACRESQFVRMLRDLMNKDGIVDFSNPVALIANEKLSCVRVLRVGAADEGIQRFDSMDQARLVEEFERPISRRRCGPVSEFSKSIHDIIGADRPVTAPNEFQGVTPQRREP